VPVVGAQGTNSALGGEYGVRVAGIAEDQGQGRLVYEPGHPDANEAGYVRYPDIDTTQELVKLMDAKRIYEANAAVFTTAKSMLRAALDI
jgi:flagellar basal-body rod protein FlgC